MSLSTEAPITKVEPAIRKFLFERSFDDASVVHRAQERKAVLMKPEQIDALKKESYDSGFAAGQAAMQESQTTQLAAVLGRVEHNIDALIQNLSSVGAEQEAHMRQAILAIARKLMPAFTARNGLQEIEAVMNDAIREMAREPRLVVRVHESEFEAVNEKAQAIAAQRAYTGKVIVLADADIASGDCRIEWADGGVERTMTATMQAIEQTITPST